MANKTTPTQPLPIVQNGNGRGVNKMHTNYIQSNINGYDQSILFIYLLFIYLFNIFIAHYS